MRICEALYQKGFISYPRTETAFFSDGTDFNGLLAIHASNPTWGTYVQSLLNGGFFKPRKGKGDDHAHPPIHPTKQLDISAAGSICIERVRYEL